jgi:NADH-quinone oxidoreductase subunit N
VPPLAGFLGKFLLFGLPVADGHYLLVALALMNAAWSLYYYLRLVKEAYVPEAKTTDGFSEATFPSWVATGILGAALLLLGLWPGVTESLSRLAGALIR